MSQDLFRFRSVSVVVYLLVVLFGVSSWVDINGLFVELPILVQNLPEGWDLPSYMAIIIQVANVAPLAYTVASSIYPHRAIEVPVIYLIISTGAVSCLLLAFLWDKTYVISGTEHSLALFILQFFLALVDCTSSVAFLPFMSLFKPQYMTAYFIGEGLSGLIPSLVALGQGAGDMVCVNGSSWSSSSSSSSFNETGTGIATTSSLLAALNLNLNSSAQALLHNLTAVTTSASPISAPAAFSVYPQYQPPKFTVKVFFMILMALLLISALSFTLLNYWSYCQKEYVVEVPEEAGVNRAWSDADDTETDCSTTPINSESDFEAIPIRSSSDDGRLKSVIYHGSDSTKTQALYQQNPKFDQMKIVPCSKSKRNAIAKSNRSGSYSASSGSSSASSSNSSRSDVSSSSSPRSTKLSPPLPKSKYVVFMVLTAWLCALSNGMLPAIQTYSCLPYGIKPYHLSVTLASIANPLACFAMFFLKMTSVTGTVAMSLVGTGLSAFILYTAFASPDPPLVDHSMGPVVIISAWILVVFVLTYTKVAIATICRHQGRRALLWVGVNTQLGSLIGAIVIFVLVNNLALFKVANPCLSP